jgi:hypothetical protein
MIAFEATIDERGDGAGQRRGSRIKWRGALDDEGGFEG